MAMSEINHLHTINYMSDLPGFNGKIIKVRLISLTQKFLQGLDLINSGIWKKGMGYRSIIKHSFRGNVLLKIMNYGKYELKE